MDDTASAGRASFFCFPFPRYVPYLLARKSGCKTQEGHQAQKTLAQLKSERWTPRPQQPPGLPEAMTMSSVMGGWPLWSKSTHAFAHGGSIQPTFDSVLDGRSARLKGFLVTTSCQCAISPQPRDNRVRGFDPRIAWPCCINHEPDGCEMQSTAQHRTSAPFDTTVAKTTDVDQGSTTRQTATNPIRRQQS